MASQRLQQPSLGQALQPNIWDVVALILVIGAMVLIVYGGEQTALPLSALFRQMPAAVMKARLVGAPTRKRVVRA